MIAIDLPVTRHEIATLEDLLKALDAMLAPRSRGLCVSIFTEGGRTYYDASAARVRFKTEVLNRRAEALSDPANREAAEALLRPAAELDEDLAFWKGQRGGLAYLADEHGANVIECACRFPTLSRFGGDYHLLPLLHAASNARRFYLLALSERSVLLLRVSELGEERLSGVSASFEEALWSAPSRAARRDEKQPTSESRHAAENSRRALRVIDAEVARLIESRAPLVIAAADYLAADFREVSAHRHLRTELLPGAPEGIPAEDLVDEARDLMQPYFAEQDRLRAEEAIAALQWAPETTITDLPAIVEAASDANIATLTAAAESDLEARLDGRTPSLSDEALPAHLRIDLIDFAARQTLETDGELHLVGSGDLPESTPVIARTRWKPVRKSG